MTSAVEPMRTENWRCLEKKEGFTVCTSDELLLSSYLMFTVLIVLVIASRLPSPEKYNDLPPSTAPHISEMAAPEVDNHFCFDTYTCSSNLSIKLPNVSSAVGRQKSKCKKKNKEFQHE